VERKLLEISELSSTFCINWVHSGE